MSNEAPLLTVRGALRVIDLDVVRPLGVDAFITTRHGGVSQPPYDTLNLGRHVGDDPEAVHHNRCLVAEAIGVSPDHLVTTQQVHGAEVSIVQSELTGAVGDALLTSRDDVALMIMAADCLPLLVVDSATATIGVVHAGWRGLAAGVIPRTLEHLTPRTTHVVIGPGISATRYQVGSEVADHFRAVPGAVVADGVPGKWRLDLCQVAAYQLRNAGVPENQVHRVNVSTDDGTLLFSDRAQRPCGRFALVARRSPYDLAVDGDQ